MATTKANVYEMVTSRIIAELPTVPSYRSDIKALFIPFIFLFLYYSFYDRLRIHFYLPHSDLFLLIKTECHHIALIQMLAAQVINHNYRLH